MRPLNSIFGIGLWAISTLAHSAFITVNTADWEFNNDGDCSLLEAVGSANDNTGYDNCTAGSAVGTDSIFISVNGTISMTGNLSIEERVNIFGLGQNATILDGNAITLHFLVNMPDDTHAFDLANVTLRNGRDTVPGGAIWIQRSGDLRFDSMRFESNQGSLGGAIAATAPVGDAYSVEIIDVEFIGNVSTGSGGAAAFPGFPSFEPPENVRIERSVFDSNQASGNGGALFFDDVGGGQIETTVFRNNETINGSGSSESGGAVLWGGFPGRNNLLSIRRSTFEANTSQTGGGAIALFGAIVTIENSTLVGNRARSSRGLAISLNFDAVGGIFHSTLVDHDNPNASVDTSIDVNNESSLAIDHSVIWNFSSDSGGDCNVNLTDASLSSLGFNFDTDGTCTSHATDQSGIDPLLWPLGDYGDGVNGRVIETVLPQPGSPLVDGGQSAPCTGAFSLDLTIDQRNIARPLNGDGTGGANCDVGAVEFDIVNDPVGQVLNVNVSGAAGGTVISTPDGIDCPGDCGGIFIDGSTVTLSAQADAGFLFNGWGGACTGHGSCQVVMNGNQDVTASFVNNSFPLSISVAGAGIVTSNPGAIDCPGNCNDDFVNGTLVTLSAIPSPGFELASWSGDCSGAGNCQVTMDQARNVIANFQISDVQLTIEMQGSGSGRVTSSPAGIDCTSDCSASFQPATTVDLTATPDAGNTFQNWTGACGGTGTCSVGLNADTQVGAVFLEADSVFIDDFE